METVLLEKEDREREEELTIHILLPGKKQAEALKTFLREKGVGRLMVKEITDGTPSECPTDIFIVDKIELGVDDLAVKVAEVIGGYMTRKGLKHKVFINITGVEREEIPKLSILCNLVGAKMYELTGVTVSEIVIHESVNLFKMFTGNMLEKLAKYAPHIKYGGQLKELSEEFNTLPADIWYNVKRLNTIGLVEVWKEKGKRMIKLTEAGEILYNLIKNIYG